MVKKPEQDCLGDDDDTKHACERHRINDNLSHFLHKDGIFVENHDSMKQFQAIGDERDYKHHDKHVWMSFLVLNCVSKLKEDDKGGQIAENDQNLEVVSDI